MKDLKRPKQVKLNLSTSDITVIKNTKFCCSTHSLFPLESLLPLALLHASKIMVLRHSSKRLLKPHFRSFKIMVLRHSSKRLLKPHFNDALKRNTVFFKNCTIQKTLGYAHSISIMS